MPKQNHHTDPIDPLAQGAVAVGRPATAREASAFDAMAALMDATEEALAPAAGTAPRLPLYQCHKRVRAVKIREVRGITSHKWLIVPEGPCLDSIPVTLVFVAMHSPQPGGYFVVYDDGYQSYSPAAAFEAGYTLIQDGE
jgi:hypothetical protein